ncbi:Ribose 5-phosphate isomerase [Pedobacter cryoconitis]|uniref:Ribose-5-phosphate isomerase A n=1 Tax=Pedobacter cryoconitis TaxID=188932 RepID=A0A127VD08_9SPHI|nr:ribose-5-phosphate isomerase RpiA [Pedobacter cryoconitis]AMP99236.1 Ribose 5-phosphate isomerase [Pedobacter cryoconitis]
MDKQSIDKKDLEKQIAAREAVKFIQQNDIVGLGTGSTAFFAIQEIAALVKNGLKIKGVPTSEHTASLALSLGIELLPMDQVKSIDITIDGADEFDTQLNLVKGGGGALFREKIVASLTKNEIIIADSGKLVTQLGKFKVPIEVVPIALTYVLQQLGKLNGKGEVRMKDNAPFITDNHNIIVDADFGLISDPAALSASLNRIEGILAHGLFVQLTSKVIMGKGTETIIYAGN